MVFKDRKEAGRLLLREVEALGLASPVVLGIPRGGVVVAAEVARGLEAPIDVIIPRKIGAPSNAELAIGAIAQDGTVILDEAMVRALRVERGYIEREARRQTAEIDRRLWVYRGDRPAVGLGSMDVIVVDDGIATGLTMTAALRSVSNQSPSSVVLAVPVAPAEAVERLAPEVDHLVCLATPEPFYAVGQWYARFDQVDDDEVISILNRDM
ncbi:MAG: phosphoribosyltransferase [Ignavibacteriales bacterium]